MPNGPEGPAGNDQRFAAATGAVTVQLQHRLDLPRWLASAASLADFLNWSLEPENWSLAATGRAAP